MELLHLTGRTYFIQLIPFSNSAPSRRPPLELSSAGPSPPRVPLAAETLPPFPSRPAGAARCPPPGWIRCFHKSPAVAIKTFLFHLVPGAPTKSHFFIYFYPPRPPLFLCLSGRSFYSCPPVIDLREMTERYTNPQIRKLKDQNTKKAKKTKNLKPSFLSFRLRPDKLTWMITQRGT